MAHSYGPIVLPTHCHAHPLSVLSSVSLQCGWLRSTTTTTISPHSPSRPQRVCACVYVKVVHTELDRVFASPLSVRPGPPTMGVSAHPKSPRPAQPPAPTNMSPPPPPLPPSQRAGAGQGWCGTWSTPGPSWTVRPLCLLLPRSRRMTHPTTHPPTLPH